jgi:hypothetical protein
MISSSLILQISQAAKIMRRFFYEAPAEIMRIYTTSVRLKSFIRLGHEFQFDMMSLAFYTTFITLS